METGHVYSKSDDRLRVIRELIKRDCLTDALEENQIERLAKANLLYLVTEKFANIDLHPQRVDNAQMGHVFEQLSRKFA